MGMVSVANIRKLTTKRNRCMRLEFNGNRSLIRLKFADDNIKACGAVLVCADVDCS